MMFFSDLVTQEMHIIWMTGCQNFQPSVEHIYDGFFSTMHRSDKLGFPVITMHVQAPTRSETRTWHSKVNLLLYAGLSTILFDGILLTSTEPVRCHGLILEKNILMGHNYRR
jgi:hypothetical protein